MDDDTPEQVRRRLVNTAAAERCDRCRFWTNEGAKETGVYRIHPEQHSFHRRTVQYGQCVRHDAGTFPDLNAARDHARESVMLRGRVETRNDFACSAFEAARSEPSTCRVCKRVTAKKVRNCPCSCYVCRRGDACGVFFWACSHCGSGVDEDKRWPWSLRLADPETLHCAELRARAKLPEKMQLVCPRCDVMMQRREEPTGSWMMSGPTGHGAPPPAAPMKLAPPTGAGTSLCPVCGWMNVGVTG